MLQGGPASAPAAKRYVDMTSTCQEPEFSYFS
jgi:hypothetical protein